MSPRQLTVLREALADLRSSAPKLTALESLALGRLEGLLFAAELELNDAEPPTVRSGDVPVSA